MEILDLIRIANTVKITEEDTKAMEERLTQFDTKNSPKPLDLDIRYNI